MLVSFREFPSSASGPEIKLFKFRSRFSKTSNKQWLPLDSTSYSGTAPIDSNSWLWSFSSSDSLAKPDQKSHSFSNFDITCRLHPKTEKCFLRRTHFKAGRHQGTSESKVSFTSCLMRCLHLIDFWRHWQHRCILRCLWYPTILCVLFREGWAKK